MAGIEIGELRRLLLAEKLEPAPLDLQQAVLLADIVQFVLGARQGGIGGLRLLPQRPALARQGLVLLDLGKELALQVLDRRDLVAQVDLMRLHGCIALAQALQRPFRVEL